MAFVKNINDIEKNAFALLDAIHKGGRKADIALKLVKGGRVFYPIHYGDQIAFAPSKFIGYLNNSIEEHERNKRIEERDGRETNEAIRKILGIPKEDSAIEETLSQYCRSLGIKLERHKHKFWRIETAKRFRAPIVSAINDIYDTTLGSDDPEYKRRMVGSYIRIESVRRNVLERANGRCEFCGDEGFIDRRGQRFVETHHIIALSEQGEDKPTNVIALCPNHHRQAHFGKNWKSLQKKFKQIIEPGK